MTTEKTLTLCLHQLFIAQRMLPGPNLILRRAISYLHKHQPQTETNLILQIKNVCASQVVRLSSLQPDPLSVASQQQEAAVHWGSRVSTAPPHTLKPPILSDGPWGSGEGLSGAARRIPAPGSLSMLEDSAGNNKKLGGGGVEGAALWPSPEPLRQGFFPAAMPTCLPLASTGLMGFPRMCLIEMDFCHLLSDRTRALLRQR